MKRRAIGGLAFGAVALAGCFSLDISGPREIQISLTADQSSAVVGQEVTFRYEASGGQIVSVVIDYGDGHSDSVRAQGATTAGGRVKHAYGASGSFVVTGRVEDASLVTHSDDVTVQINP